MKSENIRLFVNRTLLRLLITFTVSQKESPDTDVLVSLAPFDPLRKLNRWYLRFDHFYILYSIFTIR